MKKNKLFLRGLIIALSLLTSTINATVYEDAEDNSTARWIIIDNIPSGATVTNLYDTTLQSHIINLQGDNYNNAYIIGGDNENNNSWHNTQEPFLKWKIKNSGGFLLDVVVETQNGLRYIRYSDTEVDMGIESGNILNKALGYSASDGTWHTFTKDLESDLKSYESNNSLIAIDGIVIRGNCKIDDIELLETPPIKKDFIVYEDAEDNSTARWSIVENTSSTATILNVLDETRVIEFHSNDLYTSQYKLSFHNNKNNFNIKWNMKTTEGFMIDIEVMTTNGERLLRYTDEDISVSNIDEDVLLHGLGYPPANGSWNSVIRNLEKDLKSLEPNNNLLSIDSFLVRSNGKFDNIELFTSPEKVYEDAQNGNTQNWTIYAGSNTATITNIYDNSIKSRVISLNGNSYANKYLIGSDYPNEGEAWNDTKHKNIECSIKNSDGFVLSLVVNTQNGVRYINYVDANDTLATIDGDTLLYGIGESASNGTWHTYIRNIEADIKQLEPTNKLLSVEGLIVIGSISIDNLSLFNTLHPTQNQAGLILSFNDTTISSWYNLRTMFAKYKARATFFVSHFFSLDNTQINQLKTLENEGSEIGCHTYSHKGVQKDFNSDPTRVDEYMQDQIIPAYNLMINAGFNPVSFAYPYGEHQVDYDNAVRAYFPNIRLTYDDFEANLVDQKSIYHSSNSHYNFLFGAGIDTDFNNPISEIETALIKARKNGEIITFYAHDVVDDINKSYNILPQKLESVIENAKNLGLKFYTYKEAYAVGNQN